MTKNITFSDTSNTTAFVGSAVEGTVYGDLQVGSPPLALSDATITVNHGESAGLDRWAGFWLSSLNGATSYTFTNETLVGNGNLAFMFKATGAQPNANFSGLNGSGFTGRILIANTGSRGVFATYSGTGLANAEIVFTANGTENKVGKQTLATGTNAFAHNWSIETNGAAADASIAGITSAAVTGTAKANKLVFKEAGKGTLTLTGGCETNKKYSFNGDVGSNTAYNNLVMEGGEQEFLGTSYFGTVTVKGGALTLSGTTTIKGDVLVEGGRLALTAGTTIEADKTITLAGGQIDNLTLGLAHTLRQTGTTGTLNNLTLSGGTVSFEGLNGTPYSLTGTLNLAAITTLDLTGGTGYADGSALFTGVSFTPGFEWKDSEWLRYFDLQGSAQEWKIVYDQQAGALKLAANDAAVLTWDNVSSSSFWNTTDANWGAAGVLFKDGDSAVFSGTEGTVTVADGGITALKTTVGNASRLVLNGGTLTGQLAVEGGSSLTVDNAIVGAVTISDTSTLVIGSGSLEGAVTLADATATLAVTNTNGFVGSSRVQGGGVVDIRWSGTSGQINDYLDLFTGTLQITSGRYDAGNTPLAAAGIAVKDGGQFHITGGTWSQEFTISGNGLATAPGIAEAGNADSGALRFENGTISGKVTLDGNATVMVHNGTGTFSGAIVGSADSTLTKKGAGTLTISNTNLSNLNLSIAEGIVSLAQDKTYSFGTVTVQGGATLQTHWNARFTIANLSMKDGSYLDLNNGGSTFTPTLTFTEMTVQGMAHIKNQVQGAIKIDGTIVGENGTLHFTTGSGTNALTVNSEMSGTLNITKDVAGTLTISNANNTYEGDMSVSAGEINVSGGINGANNTYAAVENGTLKVSGANGNIRNSNITVKRNGATNATITSATVGTSSIYKEAAATQGSVGNAAIDISAATYAVEDVALSDSLVNLKVAGSLTLTNVTLAGTTKLAGDAAAAGTKTVHFAGSGNSLTMPAGATGIGHDTFNTGATTLTSVYVYDISSHFSEVTLTGHLALDVSALLGTLPGSYDYVAFDFGTDNNVVLDESLTASVTPNAYNSGELAGTVSGHVVYFDTKSVPEPASSALALLGASALLLRRRRRGV